MASEFIYPGSRRTPARLRQVIFAGIIAALCLFLLTKLPAELTKEIVEFLQEYTGSEKSGLGGLWLLLTMGIFFLTNKTQIADFHLFPYFDQTSFNPIPRRTGLLVWNPPTLENKPTDDSQTPESTPEDLQIVVWNTLNDWVHQGCGNGTMPISWLWHGQPDFSSGKNNFVPFDFAVLLGSNGVGKSQLAMELGRKLAQRHRFGDATKQSAFSMWLDALKCWRRRIIPDLPVKEDDPWDAAIVNMQESDLVYLQQWRPSKPTFLILDDPSVGHADEVVKLFETNQNSYFYPVRLLILDQFMPWELNISLEAADTENQHDYRYHGRTITVAHLNNYTWGAAQYRLATKKGRWVNAKADKPESSQHFVQANLVTRLSRDDGRLHPLCEAFEGNPYLLSLAAHWLADQPAAGEPKRTLHSLLKTAAPNEEETDYQGVSRVEGQLKNTAILRVLRERVNELIRGYKYLEKEHDALKDIRHTIALAAIAGRTKNTFHVSTAQQITLLKGDYIYAPGPWPLCEAFVDAYIQDLPHSDDDPEQALIIKAISEEPAGLLRAVKRKGRLANKIINVLNQQASVVVDPLSWFHAICFKALFIDVGALTHVLTIIEDRALDVEQAWEVLQNSNHTHAAQGHQMHYIARNTIAFALAAKRVNLAGNHAMQLQQVFLALKPWLSATNYDLSHVDKGLLEAITTIHIHLYAHLFKQIASIADQQTLDKLLITIRQKILPRVGITLCTALIKCVDAFYQQDPLQTDNTLKAEVMLWQFHTRFSELIEKDNDGMHFVQAIQDLANDGANNMRLVEKQATAWAYVAFVRCRLPTQRAQTEVVIAEIEKLRTRFPDSESIHEQLAEAWRYVAFARAQLPAQQVQTEEVIAEIEKLRTRFPDSEYIHESLATAWRYVAYARAQLPAQRAQTDAVIAEIEKLSTRFPDNEYIYADLAEAWKCVAGARCKLPEQLAQTEAVITKLEKLRTRFSDSEFIHEQLAEAWRSVAYARAQLPAQRAQTEAVITEIEKLSSRFPDSESIHQNLAIVWQYVAYARSELPAQRAQTEVVITEIEKISNHFPDNEYILNSVAEASRHVAYAKRQM